MKNIKVLWGIIIILSLVLSIFVFKFVNGNVIPSDDGRTAVVLTKDERNFILEEMRTFLINVQTISQAITNNDMTKVAELAHNAGMAAEKGTPGSIFRKVPLPMKKLGFNTRTKFDEIAEIAKTTKDAKQARQKLDTLLNNCIACHASYRLPEPQE